MFRASTICFRLKEFFPLKFFSEPFRLRFPYASHVLQFVNTHQLLQCLMTPFFMKLLAFGKKLDIEVNSTEKKTNYFYRFPRKTLNCVVKFL